VAGRDVEGIISEDAQTFARKIVSFLNNPDEDGGFWLPNIQRPFVWNEEQTCRLFRLDTARVPDQYPPGLEDEKQYSLPEVH
jgi:hypothetical protein